MEAKAIIAYVVCDDTIKFLGLKEDKQTIMTTAEVMTTAIISTLEYSGNLEKTRRALKSECYIPSMLSKGQLNIRLHSIEKHVWDSVLEKLSFENLKKIILLLNLSLTAFRFRHVKWQEKIGQSSTQRKNI